MRVDANSNPLNDTWYNLQFGNGRCYGHAKPQFNYCTCSNWLTGNAVTHNGIQIGHDVSLDLLSYNFRLLVYDKILLK